MTITLITGGNRGLGFETARQLLARGHTVYLGARDAAQGEAAAKRLGARFVQLDVTNDASVAACVRSLPGLDVLVNNAGIAGPWKSPTELTADEVRTVYETNVFGVVRVTQAMLPLLEKSSAPVIVNVGSGLGSFARVHDPSFIESKVPALAYCSSKSALSMVTVHYARALPRYLVNIVDPGYTATDFNQHRGTQTVEEGAEAIVRLACVGRDGPTGTFSNRHGPMGW